MNVIINAEVRGQVRWYYVRGTLVCAAEISTVICHCQPSFLLIATGIKTYTEKGGS